MPKWWDKKRKAIDKAKKYRAVHSKLPHGHWMAD